MGQLLASEPAYRIAAASIFFPIAFIRRYYSSRAGSARATAREVKDSVASGRDSRVSTIALAALAIPYFVAVILYIVYPALMGWSAVAEFASVRWAGALCGWAGMAGLISAQRALADNFSVALRVKSDQTLVTHGPYARMRHPIYSFGLVVNAGLGVLTANWFILLCGVAVVLVAMLSRAKREEQMMLGAYGDQYQAYLERTGRFFPRLRRG